MDNPYVLVASIVFGLLFIMGCLFVALDTNSLLIRIAAIVLGIAVTIGGLGTLVKGDNDLESKHPCLRTERTVVLVGKTLVPVDRCVERGTVVE